MRKTAFHNAVWAQPQFIYYGHCQRKGVFLSDGRIAVWRKMIKFAPEIQNNTRYDDN